MRKIEFRGKWESNGEWIYGSLVAKKNGERLISNYNKLLEFEGLYVHPETVGQYTGLKDKNGTEIFEGDIVSRFFDTQRSVVEFTDGCFVSIIQRSGASEPVEEILCNDLSVTKVIGNIHDNPELLKGEHGKEAAKCDCGEGKPAADTARTQII